MGVDNGALGIDNEIPGCDIDDIDDSVGLAGCAGSSLPVYLFFLSCWGCPGTENDIGSGCDGAGVGSGCDGAGVGSGCDGAGVGSGCAGVGCDGSAGCNC
jgi:hypothetical protein